MLNKLIKLLDIHTMEVVKKSISSTFVKMLGIVVSLILSIVIGRNLGADGLGIIDLSVRIVNVFVIISLLGMPNVIIKEVAIALTNKKMDHISNTLYTGYIYSGITSILISFLLITIAPWLSNNVFKDARLTIPLIIACLMLVPMTFSRLFSSGMVGYKKIWQSNLVDQTLSIWVTGLIIFGMWVFGYEFTIINVAIFFAVGRIVVMIVVGLYWNYLFKYKNPHRKVLPKLLKTAGSMLVVSLSAVIFTNADVIILGWLSDSRNVGLYTVASRLALFTSILLKITNSSIAPKIAAMYANSQQKALQRMIRRITGILSIISIAIMFLFVVFGQQILSLWGQEFTSAYWILIILSFGQFINLSSGALGVILLMTGHEKTQRDISMAFVFINLVCNIIFIYLYGAVGAAMASATVFIGINITKTIYVYKKLRISLLPNFILKSGI